MARWTKMPHGMEVGFGTRSIVLDGDPAPPTNQGTAPPQFLAHVYCGQTVGWIEMPLGMEVSLRPGNIVLDGDPGPPNGQGQSSPHFRNLRMQALQSV